MDFFGFVNLFGGLALFLYGMTILGTGLEKISGGRLEKTMEKLTNNVLSGVLFGAVVTGAIQSSSATTVILVGLVNSRIMSLHQAIGVIMGANIGTTVTAHILRLADISSESFYLRLLKPTTLAPMVAIVGILLILAAKKPAKKNLGQVLLGFAILFTGMFSMEAAVAPLREVPAVAHMFATMKNPFIGVLVGAGVTAVIQSSSASVGILQALSSTGLITFSAAVPIILGQNIGTCVTAMLASIGVSKNAKRTAFVHLFFNIIGTIVVLFAVYLYQYTIGLPFWDSIIDKGGIANFHTFFNVTVTLMFLPASGILEKLVRAVVRDSPNDLDLPDVTATLDDRFLVSAGLAVSHGNEAVVTMGKLAMDNFNAARGLFVHFDLKVCERIREVENVIDKYEDRLSRYLLELSRKEISESDSSRVSQLMYVMSEFERIGDYTINIVEIIESMQENKTSFSPRAQSEMDTVFDAASEIIGMAVSSFEASDVEHAMNIEPLEEVIDAMVEMLKNRHIERLRQGKCTIEAAFPFVESLANIERISDHCSNTATYIIGHDRDYKGFDRHQYTQSLHKGSDEQYRQQFARFQAKYLAHVQVADE